MCLHMYKRHKTGATWGSKKRVEAGHLPQEHQGHWQGFAAGSMAGKKEMLFFFSSYFFSKTST